MEFIPAKTILNKVKWGDQWFGLRYNFNLYKECSHGCIYCDSRCNYYHIENFDRVRAKENCLAILEKELSRKKEKGIVGIGAMSDAYNPQEKKAVRTMSDAGIFSGIILDPILPFITDSEEDIREMVRLGAENGARYIWSYFMAVTLRDNQRLYFYDQLDRSFPGLREKYQTTFGNKGICKPLNQDELKKIFVAECDKYGILYKMEDIIRESKRKW